MRTIQFLKPFVAGKPFFLLILLALWAGGGASAQLKANFSVDRDAGCSPLLVQFTNLTTGASANARYTWDLGNGNTSFLFAPGATYRNEQTYTVRLTVADGADTASHTAVITVHKKPSVAFNVANNSGCFPLPARFSSIVQAGAGNIANYTWDFGDGTVAQGPAEASPVHTYRFAQQFSVRLTVANTLGCVSTAEQNNMVQVQDGVRAAFTSNRKALCQPGDAVQFQSNSSGSGTLSYLWDFGDGATSTQAAPRHVYNSRGSFTVKLRVTNAQGCTDEMVVPDYVHVANFTIGIQGPQVACANTGVGFRAAGNIAPDSLRWSFGTGILPANTDSVNRVFATAGSKNVGLTAYWGTCPVTVGTRLEVQAPPAVTGFVQQVSASCQLPFTTLLSDTSTGTIQSYWEVAGAPAQAGRNAQFTFDAYGTYPVRLTVENSAGCQASATRNVVVAQPGVAIRVTGTSGRYGVADCVGMQVSFATQSAVPLTAYRWDFGDGSAIATSATPRHQFNTPGRYRVTLRYTTTTGCTDTVSFGDVEVYGKPRLLDFTSETNVCSSNPVGFTATSDTIVRRFYWDYGDGSGLDSFSTIHHFNEHKYRQEGVYTVRLIANGGGACADTITKTRYITVHPPFQNIQNIFNDCLIDRNRIFLQLNTRGVVTGTWDFGDSTSLTSVPAAFNIVPHSFAQPGLYRVKHTSVNGACSATDSVYVPVPGKQTPVLSGSKDFVCLEDTMTLTISGVNLLDLANYRNNPEQYRLSQLKYGDGRLFNGVVTLLDGNWATGYKIMVNSREINASGLKAFITSNLTGCTDSTNLFAVRFSGPKARVGQVTPVCYNQEVLLRDSSAGSIVKWQWQVNNAWLTEQASGDVRVKLPAPGIYPVTLKVTDSDGCYHFASVNGGVTALGVQAAFQLPDTVVAINTPAQFTNTSVLAPGATASFTWTYDARRRTATTTHLVHSYPNIGWDTIRLAARTLQGGCTDTAYGIIHHDNINAKFSFTATYINGNACPPMLVKFTNLSRNTRRTLWTFGDGSSAENQNNPERTYRMGGTYKVTLYTFGTGSIVDSTTEYITVKGPSASIDANRYAGCLSQQVTFSARVNYARDYYWDFGDGTLLRSRDTLVRHDYTRAGVYLPALVLSDSTGCSVAAELPRPVVIDSLSLAIGGIPQLMCDAATVYFDARVASIAVEKMGQPLQYQWRFPASISTLAAPVQQFRGEGRYPVSVTATSPYGCVQTATDTVWIRQTVKGTIEGRPEVCAGQAFQFTAGIPRAAATWRWMLHDGRIASTLQSPVLNLQDSGFYPVRLVVTNDGCVDTARQDLWVHPNPVIRFANPQEHVCRGLATTLQASGGHSYRWSGSEPILLGAALSKAVVFPAVTTHYRVVATSFFGCESADSMVVRVSQPFKLQPIADTFVCRGLSVPLRAAGAATYQWNGPEGTLDRTTGAVVAVKPNELSRYRVIGTDSMQCFKDTAYAQVRVEALPLVRLGPDQVVLTGTELRLGARTSADVVQYRWQPAAEVACATCPQTTAEPRKPTTYSLQVTNIYGCVAADTLHIDLKCTDSRVFIPNAFTPDRNGLNETFSVRGKGAWVKQIMIYDRWGKMVYEAANLQLNDSRSGWNGTCNGQPCPTGTYAYMVELVCDTGEGFVKKGTVTVVR